jgi:hypothetical protein
LGVVGHWWEDRRGAAAVQFIAVLPVFAIIVIGFWAFYGVYSTRDALCDATDEARDYLQVEGPRFPVDTIIYPAGWEAEAQRIIESELRSHQWYDLLPVAQDEVYIWPEGERRAPQEMEEVSVEELRNNLFFVRVTKTVTNPVAIFMPDETGTPRRTLTLTCQSTGFYEGNPIGPTGGPGRRDCPRPRENCTPGPEPTECTGPNCEPTPECPVCEIP